MVNTHLLMIQSQDSTKIQITFSKLFCIHIWIYIFLSLSIVCRSAEHTSSNDTKKVQALTVWLKIIKSEANISQIYRENATICKYLKEGRTMYIKHHKPDPVLALEVECSQYLGTCALGRSAHHPGLVWPIRASRGQRL